MPKVLKAVSSCSIDDLKGLPDALRNENGVADLVRSVDPTGGKNAPWILNLWRNGKLLYEDVAPGINAPVYDALERFEKTKSKISDPKLRSILAYKNLGQLEDALPSAKEVQLPGGRQRKKLDSFRASKQSFGHKTPSGLDWRVPLTPFAAQFYGRRTKWCTSAIDNAESFHNYAEDAPLFIFTLPDGTQFQGCVTINDTITFLNSRDSDVTEAEGKLLRPFVSEISDIMASVVATAEDGSICGPDGSDIKQPEKFRLKRRAAIEKRLSAITIPAEPTDAVAAEEPEAAEGDEIKNTDQTAPVAATGTAKRAWDKTAHEEWYKSTVFADKNDFITLSRGRLRVDVGGIDDILRRCSLGDTDDARIHLCNIASALAQDGTVVNGDPILAMERFHDYLQRGASSAADPEAHARTVRTTLTEDYGIIVSGLVKSMKSRSAKDVAAMLDKMDERTLCGVVGYIAMGVDDYASIREHVHDQKRLDGALAANFITRNIARNNYQQSSLTAVKNGQTEDEAHAYALAMLRIDNPIVSFLSHMNPLVSFLSPPSTKTISETAGFVKLRSIMDASGAEFRNAISGFILMSDFVRTNSVEAKRLKDLYVGYLGQAFSDQSKLSVNISHQYIRLVNDLEKKADHIAIGLPMVAKSDAGALYLCQSHVIAEMSEASHPYPYSYLTQRADQPDIPSNENAVQASQYAGLNESASLESVVDHALVERLLVINKAMSLFGRTEITLDEIKSGKPVEDDYCRSTPLKTIKDIVPKFIQDRLVSTYSACDGNTSITITDNMIRDLIVTKDRHDIIGDMQSLHCKIECACKVALPDTAKEAEANRQPTAPSL